MNIINVEHISKVFGEKTIFEDASVGIQEEDKVGIIGINGTGKTTFLRMIAGLESPDEGKIIMQNGLKLAYLPQNPEFPADATILSYIQDSEDEWKVQSHLQRLGITDYQARLSHLSGGQRKKVAMAKILASDFDVLLLDEPTNHLDAQMVSWLENYLQGFKGVILMVTHDAYAASFADRILIFKDGSIIRELLKQDADRRAFYETIAQEVARLDMER